MNFTAYVDDIGHLLQVTSNKEFGVGFLYVVQMKLHNSIQC